MKYCRFHFHAHFIFGCFFCFLPFCIFAFNYGDQVQISGGTFNIRQTPAGTVLGTQTTGAQGTIIGGPTVAVLSGTSYTWYNVNFLTGVDGWVADFGLIPVGPTNLAVGIDVYSGNSTITWSSVKAAGINFAFAKATEGATYTDSKYATYMQNAHAVGMLIGSYHFAHPLNNTGTNGAVTEAQHFLAVAKPYITNGYLPPVLDVEDEPYGTDPNDPCSDGTGSAGTSINLVCKMGKSALSAWVRAWVNEVKRQTGITPMLYMNRNSATNGMESDLAACPLWLAHFTTPPDTTQPVYGPWTNSWTFLQYSFTNSVSGVSQPTVDYNVFSGDVRALKLFAAQIATTNLIPPQISGIGGSPLLPPKNGKFQFELSSPTKTQVTVQTSPDLQTWSSNGVVSISYGHGTFTDTNVPIATNRFYRPVP